MESNSKQESLSYYEYLMLDKYFVINGVEFLVDYHLRTRKWLPHENMHTVGALYRTIIKIAISSNILESDLLETVYKDDVADYANMTDDDYCEIDIYRSTIRPMVFFKFAHRHGLEVPNEILEYAGIKDKVKLTLDYVDKIATQAVAKTLWLEHPDMTTEEIINHHAVKYFADGKFKAHSTLRKWISAVDTRNSKSKPGPNKKAP